MSEKVILSQEMHEVLTYAMSKESKERLLNDHKEHNFRWAYNPYNKLRHLTYRELEKALDGDYIVPKRGDYVTNKETKETAQFGYIDHRRRELYTLDHGITGFDPENFRFSTEEEIKEYAEKEIKSKVWRFKSSTHGYTPVESKVEFDGNEAILTVRMVKEAEESE